MQSSEEHQEKYGVTTLRSLRLCGKKFLQLR